MSAPPPATPVPSPAEGSHRGGPPAPSGEASAPTEPVHIVVVDDDDFSLAFLRTLLEEAGHDVRCFRDAASALEAMTESPPDVLLTDWFMPGRDGPSLIRDMRSIPSLMGVYCVLLTAFDREGLKLAGLEEGADDYLPKESCREELLVRVRVGARVRRLERAAALGAMAATLGHEINNPLTAVVGYLELAVHHLDRGDAASVRTCVDKARLAGERIAEIVRRLIRARDARLKTYLPGTVMMDLGTTPPPEGAAQPRSRAADRGGGNAPAGT